MIIVAGAIIGQKIVSAWVPSPRTKCLESFWQHTHRASEAQRGDGAQVSALCFQFEVGARFGFYGAA
jgi:hypothetical protein